MALLGSRARHPDGGEILSQTFDAVTVVDVPEGRIRRPADALAMIASTLGIAIVLLLAVYAHQTTVGVTEDVQSIAAFLNSLLQVIVNLLQGMVSLVLPLTVLAMLLWRRQIRLAIDGVCAMAAGIGVGLGAIALLGKIGTTELTASLTVTVHDDTVVALSAYAVGFAAMLVAVGPRSRRRVVSVSWTLLWIVLGVQIITGAITLPGALVTVLLGQFVGSAVRYIAGSHSERCVGPELLSAIRAVGISPRAVVRIAPALAHLEQADLPFADAQDSVSRGLTRLTEDRVYAVQDTAGARFDVVVLDEDRQVIGFLERAWQAIRVRGLERRPAVSLRSAAEQAGLLGFAATAAGVHTPSVQGLSQKDDSMLIVTRHPTGMRSLRDVPDDELTDRVLRDSWRELLRAHEAGLAHHAITADCVLVADPDQAKTDWVATTVWLTGWQYGEVAASELARRMDCVQLLTVHALRVGTERALAVAGKELGQGGLIAIAPALQPVALPSVTRADAKASPDVIKKLRATLIDEIPEADGELLRLGRFSWRTAIAIIFCVAVVGVILATMNFDQIVQAFSSANPVWIVVAFICSLLTYLGATWALMGFSPIKLPFWRTTLVELAASIIALVAPAAVGHSALSVQYLRKNKVTMSLALATIALLQVSLFVTTIVLLVLIALVTGDSSALNNVPSIAVVIGVAVVVLVGLLLLITPTRQWIWAKIGPTMRQIWPRVLWVLTQPRKLTLALLGNFLITLSYVGAFWCCLRAFGVTNLAFTDVALVYLLGNSAGAAIPTPGGIGGVEAFLTAGLQGLGVAPAVAASVAVLFRALTYWGMVPPAWFALRHLRKHSEI